MKDEQPIEEQVGDIKEAEVVEEHEKAIPVESKPKQIDIIRVVASVLILSLGLYIMIHGSYITGLVIIAISGFIIYKEVISK